MPLARPAFAIGLVFAVAPPAWAGPINAGFETGNFAGWSIAGDALVVTAAVGAAPTQGVYQALLTTASTNGDANTFSGTDAVPAGDLRTFLGLPGSALGAAAEGSAVRQTFTAGAGDVLRFNYKFLTTEGANRDFGFVVLGGVSLLTDTTTGSFSPSLVVLDPVFGDPASETAWRTFSFAFPTAGTYNLGIGVADAGDEFIPSGLLIDNARLLPADADDNPSRNIVQVPEPTSWFILATVLVGWMLIRGSSR